MKQEKPFSTYAITLYFDEDTTSAIRELTAQLARVTENDYMTVNNVPPHLTVGMFHVSDADVGKLKNLFKDFVSAVQNGLLPFPKDLWEGEPSERKPSEENSSFSLFFTGFESFLDKVIFIKPEQGGVLGKINELLHKMFLPYFEPADNRNYLPENWYPHIALGVKLSHEQFEKGMEFLKTEDGLPASFIAQGIGGAPEAATGLSEAREAAGGDSRNTAKPGLPQGRCARITTIGLACCNPYTPVLEVEIN